MAPPIDVFISYPGPHYAEAEALAAALRARGRRVFFDGTDVRAGDRVQSILESALGEAALVAILVGPGGRQGDRLYYDAERTRAIARERDAADPVRVVPIQLGAEAAAVMPLDLSALRAHTHVDVDATADYICGLLPAPGAATPPDIQLGRLPASGRFFEGREEELALLDAAWADPTTQVQAVIGIGGEGKTALVDRWLHRMKADGYRGAARAFGWSFYSQGSSDDRQVSADLFVEETLRWLGDPEPSAGDPWAKGARIARLLRTQRTLLVLDGLEPLQFPPGESAGRIKDPGLGTLLRELAKGMDGLCLVTSRQPLRDFAEGTPGIATLKLPPLSPEIGAGVLRRWKVEGEPAELQQAVRDVKGHALAVNLLGSYVAMYEERDIRRRDRIDGLLEADDGGGHAKRVMEAYDRWLAPEDRRVLRILGLFDRSADAKALDAVLAESAIEGLTEGLTDGVQGRPWKRAVSHLQGVGLLLKEAGLDAHPLVREAFGAMLEEESPAAWKTAHGRLFEHFAVSAEYQPDDLIGLEPLYRAVVHGCAAGRHQEAASNVFRARITRSSEDYYSTKQLGAFAADLVALSHFFVQPWSSLHGALKDRDRWWLLNDAGFALRALGRLTEAVRPTEAAIAHAVEHQRWREAAISTGNLSELLRFAGRLDGANCALARAWQAVDYADRSGSAFRRMSRRTALAEMLHTRGRVAAAEALFAAAERLQAERQPSLPRLYSSSGYAYGDLLVVDRPALALERAEEWLRTKWAYDFLGDGALYHLLLGRAALATADLLLACKHLGLAMARLRRANKVEDVALGLLARAAYFRTVKDFCSAIDDLTEARAIAERGGMRLYLTDCDLEAARLALAQGDRAAAERHYIAARDAVLDIRYHRRDPELEELALALGLAPPDWLHQADIEVDLPIPRKYRKKKVKRLKGKPKRRG